MAKLLPLALSRRCGSTLHEGALTEIDTEVAGGHAFGRHLQQDAYAANLARKDQVSIVANTGQRLT